MDKFKIIFNSKLDFEEKVERASKLIKHEAQKTINKNIKTFFKGQTVWTEKTCLYKNKEDNWYNHTTYLYGDLRSVDKDDWRFCEVLNARKDINYNKLELLDEKDNLRQNHIKDYISYLKQ